MWYSLGIMYKEDLDEMARDISIQTLHWVELLFKGFMFRSIEINMSLVIRVSRLSERYFLFRIWDTLGNIAVIEE